MNSIWEGHQFGKWYPWPQQVPVEGWHIVALVTGYTVPAHFTPNKAGNSGRWKHGYGHKFSNALVVYWMPLPSAPKQQDYHDAWEAARDRETMRELQDIRAYLSDGLWIWPCGAMVDEKEDPLMEFHNTDACNVCTKAIKEVIGE